MQEARAGDIVAISGIEHPQISDTLCDPSNVQALPPLTVDELDDQHDSRQPPRPSPRARGALLSRRRQVRERSLREAMHNVALRVEDTEDPRS